MKNTKPRLVTAKTSRSIAWATARDYLDYLSDTKRIIINNFIAGITRGLGMAIGFSLLGALIIYIFTSIASQNLPYIGNFIRELMDIVNKGH